MQARSPAAVRQPAMALLSMKTPLLKTFFMPLLLLAVLAGCGQPAPSAPSTTDASKKLHFDVPLQVVYRLDDHRFVSLEDYDECLGSVYYNDTQRHIHRFIFEGDPTDYRGRLIIDDPTGMNIAVALMDRNGCGDRGCDVPLAYSTDAGRSFQWLTYMEHSYDTVEDSQE